MKQTSQKYKEKINGEVRETKAEVILNITSTVENQIRDNSEEFAISNKEQVINRKFEGNYNLLTYEDNRARLDGSFRFASNNKIENKEVGFISENMSEEDGRFAIYPFLEVEKTGEIEFFGCTVFFDNLQNEYAIDFDIEIYNGGLLINTINVIGNKDIEFTAFNEAITQFNSFKIVIKKWSKSYRRARIIEAENGLVRVYTNNNLVKVKMIEEMDFEGDGILIPELTVELVDENREYDFLNPTGIYKFLNENLNLTASIGLKVGDSDYEEIQLGDFKLSQWEKTTASMTTILTGRHKVEELTKYKINELGGASRSIYELIENIFIICGITKYEIDTSLSSIIVHGAHKQMNARELLQNLLIASSSRLYVDRTGTVKIVKGLSNIKVNDITLESATKQPEVILNSPLKSISIEVFNQGYGSEESITIEDIVGESGDALDISGNPFIISIQQAENIAEYFKTMSKYRATSTVDWRGDVAYELNDRIGVENYFGIQDGFIISNEIEYNGYLKEITKVKQKINI